MKPRGEKTRVYPKKIDYKGELRKAKERLARLRRKAHPDIGDLTGAKATVSFWTRYADWMKEKL